jgi:glycosyltransferase involved in cell wall biosynthesis
MRVGIVNWTRRRVGGAEAYLSRVIPAIVRAGHAVAFLSEVDEPADRQPIVSRETVATWCVADVTAGPALRALREWRPDIIFGHGLLDPRLEARILKIAPAVFFAHNYYGTCVSGAKTFKSPVVVPCSRRFGWRCLLLYYPRRCGGWSPVTMLASYRRQAMRLRLLRRYRAIVTGSRHMRAEYLGHGFQAERVHEVPMWGVGDDGLAPAEGVSGRGRDPSCWRVLFVGRMERLKGGDVLLDSLRLATTGLDRPVHATFAGDGPARHAWQRRAERLCGLSDRVTVEFLGWIDEARRDSLLCGCDLLVLPSVWPEPVGLVGLAAVRRGVPVAAFAVGGVPEWLSEGINGHLAPGDPPTASGLASAIVRCLRDERAHERLRAGAQEVARRLRGTNHVTVLLAMFEKLARSA